MLPGAVRIYGLSGGIASGKSTVAAMLRSLGAPVIDADLLAREVVAPGSDGLAEIVADFGPEILDERGALARKALAARVFGDSEARRRLEAITHPRIAAASAAALEELRQTGERLAFYEAALLVETGGSRALDGLVVVSAPASVQLARLRGRDGLSEGEARARIKSQLPLADKVAAADFVIDTGGSLEDTRGQVEALYKTLAS